MVNPSKRKSKAKEEPILDGEDTDTKPRIYPQTKRVKKSPQPELSDSETKRVEKSPQPEPSDSVASEDAQNAEHKKTSPRRKVVKKPAEPEWSNWVPSDDARFDGDPIPREEAQSRWPKRYPQKNTDKGKSSSLTALNKVDESEVMLANKHYSKAVIEDETYKLDDDVYVKADEGTKDYIARIVEMFEGVDNRPYFTAQWFYRGEDTIMKDKSDMFLDTKRVFLSKILDDNPLDSIVSKIKIVKLHPSTKPAVRNEKMKDYDLYYDMMYLQPCCFCNIDEDNVREESDKSTVTESPNCVKADDVSMTLLDLYSGCGAMSTGLSLGAKLTGVKLVSKWAVDFNEFACQSLRHNHPGCEVWNEKAENFFKLLKIWQGYCKKFNLIGSERDDDEALSNPVKTSKDEKGDLDDDAVPSTEEDFEVEKLLEVCYGTPPNKKRTGLYFKVKWKGYGSNHDSWEPVSLLSDCEESIKEFVTNGYKSRLLPLPGDVDVITGGPPCQGMSGHNRFRNKENPLDGDKNSQLVVYMDIIDFLKPKFVLMENVVDMTKFSKGQLMSYAIARLISMNFQARLGIMAAGSYGVSQCRFRVFLWGATVSETLPQFPLPTHKLIGRGVVTNDFKDMIVQHEENSSYELLTNITLGDAISDMPEIDSFEERDEMPYTKKPETEFQKYIRLPRSDVFGDGGGSSSQKAMLYDHIPLKLSEDDYMRVCKIPHEKGACFRNLKGVKVNENNIVYFDPNEEREMLPSGKPLVPDYAMTYVDGKSHKPFGRLSYDETVGTVVTRAEPHNQIIIHPHSDRILSVRENARLQGFPDCYRLFGSTKERYIQVGNAVAFSVSIALGHTLAKAVQKAPNKEPLVLPFKFPNCLALFNNLD